MKKMLLVSVVGAMSVFSAIAADSVFSSPYVGLRAKYDSISMEHKMDIGIETYSSVARSVYGGGIMFGAKLFDVMRAEFEYSFGMGKRTNDISNAGIIFIKEELTTHSLLGNVYYDFDIEQMGGIKPYIGAGLGVGIKGLTTEVDLKKLGLPGYTAVDDTFTSFLWNVGAGVSYAINNNFTLDIGYRYMDYGKETFDSHPSSAPGETFKNELDMSSVHEIYIGARYNF